MTELIHFSHDHPLMLISEVQKEGIEKESLCAGCQKSISSLVYSCASCNYFLHEKCAMLPTEMKHPKHNEHPLTLYPYPPYSSNGSLICDVCRIKDWKWFTYSCTICEFDVHVECALEDHTMVEHESHSHPLTRVPKKSLFECDACGTEAKDFSLFCSTCGFWIHKTCATAPNTIQHTNHNHPLLLNYFFPYENSSFTYFCDICREKVHLTNWVYCCERCRFFAHIKCATSYEGESSRAHRGDVIADDPNTIIRFPLTSEASINMLSQVLNEVSIAHNEQESDIDHHSHDHPLDLFLDQIKTATDEEVLCNCCIEPVVSAPFWGCRTCNYFLHTSCTNLPAMLHHPSHPSHPLDLYAPSSFLYVNMCNSCRRYTNCFCYKCTTCDFYLDISCAFNIPKIIKHEGHKHPMKIKLNDEEPFKCDACNEQREGSRFVWEGCDYNVEICCAEYPRTVKHDWDTRYPLTLSYPPYSDHPYRLYCEFCEEEMFPKNWAYRSCCGLLFFHTSCIFQNEFPKIKLGGILKSEYHPHPITFTLAKESKNKISSLCDHCGEDQNGMMTMQCAPRNFLICPTCCEN